MNIAVVCGGISTEREVSIRTGSNVCGALREKGHNAILLDVYFGNPNKDIFDKSKEEYNIEKETEIINLYNDSVELEKKKRKQFFGDNVIDICSQADIAFLALHGENGENGKVQATFDLLGIKYTGSGYLGSALAMDKGLTKQLLVYNNLPTPGGFVINKTSVDKTLEGHKLSVPCVVKPSCGGSSVGVSIANTQEEYIAALEEAFKYENEVIVEEFIGGREFSIGVTGGRALPIIEIIPKEGFYDYANKYLPGKTEEICPAELDRETTKKMQDCAVAVSYALRLEAYCRIDFILKPNGEFYCLEANTLPGMTATSLIPQEAAADGDDFPTLCEKLIKLSLAKYDK